MPWVGLQFVIEVFFAFIVFCMSRYCKCPVALPHGAVGWSDVCERDIS